MDKAEYFHKKAELSFLENMQKSEGLSTLTAASIANRLEQLKKETIKKTDLNNIHEEDVSFTGYFSGVLPYKRDFEFIDENGMEIYGKISSDIPYPAEINCELGHLVSIKALKRTVGSSKPCYTLLSFKKTAK